MSFRFQGRPSGIIFKETALVMREVNYPLDPKLHGALSLQKSASNLRS